MKKAIQKQIKRMRRHNRVRAKVSGTKEIPRLSVFRSNRYVYAQLIDDTEGKTLIGVSSLSEKLQGKPMVEQGKELGRRLAEKAKEQNIINTVFDRGGFLFAGAVKAIADGAREGGLKF